MRKGMLGIGAATLVVLLTALAGNVAHAGAHRIELNTIDRQYAPPPMRRKEGLLAVSNRDWDDYTMVVTRKGRISLYRGDSFYAGFKNIRIPAGTTVYLALEKDTWSVSAENTDRLKVKVREGRTSTLSLNPFGFVGNTGLMGVTNDGDRVREEVLFDNFTQPVVVQRPTIVAPPPPPTIITRPPVIIERPHPIYRPPPPPRRHHRGDSWGFSFDFNR